MIELILDLLANAPTDLIVIVGSGIVFSLIYVIGENK
jgi:hypothetical protein|tara:strand:+ start:423 stop:533 length:111 start_codon:yes stop_codon:yes gene_type:complete